MKTDKELIAMFLETFEAMEEIAKLERPCSWDKLAHCENLLMAIVDEARRAIAEARMQAAGGGPAPIKKRDMALDAEIEEQLTAERESELKAQVASIRQETLQEVGQWLTTKGGPGGYEPSSNDIEALLHGEMPD